jgi:hypothetical protein
MFSLLALFGLICVEIWTLNAAKSLRSILLSLSPLAGYYVACGVAERFTTGIVNLGVCLGIWIACVLAIIQIGGRFRDRAMRAVLNGVE